MGPSARQGVIPAGFVLAAALIFHSAPAFADVCRYQNLMPEFFAFEARTKNLAPDVRADQFMTDFVPRHPAFYGDKRDIEAFKTQEGIRKSSLRLLDPSHPETMPGFAPLTEARFHAVADTVERDFAAAQTRFLDTFPDFRCQEEIEFGPSFLHFDGHDYKDHDGHLHMLFGVDAIAILHEPEDMPAFFSHELFHIYHRQVIGARMPDPDNLVWWSLWEEGLATYVSQRMNPGLDAQQVLWFPKDMVKQMRGPGATARAARLMLADFNKSEGTNWFDSFQGTDGLPPRAGYYMGYLMAGELGKGRSLQALAHLSPDQVKARARAFLEDKAKAE